MCCVDDCNVATHANIFVLNISLLVEDRANNPVQKAATVPLSWSFLNGLLNHVVKELNVEEVLKSPFFVVQKAAAPKTGVEFRQGSIGAIRSCLATSYDIRRRRVTPSDVARRPRLSTNQRPRNYLTQKTEDIRWTD